MHLAHRGGWHQEGHQMVKLCFPSALFIVKDSARSEVKDGDLRELKTQSADNLSRKGERELQRHMRQSKFR